MDKTKIPYWSSLRNLIQERAKPRDEPVVLSNGGVTYEYLDLKGLFTNGTIMFRLQQAHRSYRRDLNIPVPTAIGGPTMGSDFLSHSVAAHSCVEWFSVRDKPKDHGLQKSIEGTYLDETSKVLLVDDVVSSGKSLLRAYDLVSATGAEIIAVMPIVHRGPVNWLTWGGRPYCPLFTSEELGIDLA